MNPKPTAVAIEAAKLKIAIARKQGQQVEPWVEDLAKASLDEEDDASAGRVVDLRMQESSTHRPQTHRG